MVGASNVQMAMSLSKKILMNMKIVDGLQIYLRSMFNAKRFAPLNVKNAINNGVLHALQALNWLLEEIVWSMKSLF